MSTDAYSRGTDPYTSHLAALSVRPTDLESAVYRSIWYGFKRGRISDEVEEDTHIRNGSVTPRFKPLRKKGLIFAMFDENGDPYTRPGLWSGKKQVIWFATVHFKETIDVSQPILQPSAGQLALFERPEEEL